MQGFKVIMNKIYNLNLFIIMDIIENIISN